MGKNGQQLHYWYQHISTNCRSCMVHEIRCPTSPTSDHVWPILREVVHLWSGWSMLTRHLCSLLNIDEYWTSWDLATENLYKSIPNTLNTSFNMKIPTGNPSGSGPIWSAPPGAPHGLGSPQLQKGKSWSFHLSGMHWIFWPAKIHRPVFGCRLSHALCWFTGLASEREAPASVCNCHLRPSATVCDRLRPSATVHFGRAGLQQLTGVLTRVSLFLSGSLCLMPERWRNWTLWQPYVSAQSVDSWHSQWGFGKRPHHVVLTTINYNL